jgi:cell division septum initiation protein DivIVA
MTALDANDWKAESWAEHEINQMLRMAQLPFAQKLEWLEEAHEMVLSMQRAQSEVEPNGENREEDE